jgi:hypothetical protein
MKHQQTARRAQTSHRARINALSGGGRYAAIYGLLQGTRLRTNVFAVTDWRHVGAREKAAVVVFAYAQRSPWFDDGRLSGAGLVSASRRNDRFKTELPMNQV